MDTIGAMCVSLDFRGMRISAMPERHSITSTDVTTPDLIQSRGNSINGYTHHAAGFFVAFGRAAARALVWQACCRDPDETVCVCKLTQEAVVCTPNPEVSSQFC